MHRFKVSFALAGALVCSAGAQRALAQEGEGEYVEEGEGEPYEEEVEAPYDDYDVAPGEGYEESAEGSSEEPYDGPPGEAPEGPSDAPAEEPAYDESTGSVDDFHDALAPHGDWVESDDYGLVWTPHRSVVGASFTPYSTNGQWQYTDQGWMFASEWDWGWAPFHYGRWYRDSRHGW